MEFIHNRLALISVVGALGAVLLSGCVDNSYDLEDIDTTARVEVKDLTLPLNLTPVQLDDLVDLSSEECIEEINGEYVLIKSGTFSSDPITIEAIVANPTHVDPTPADQELPIFGGSPVDINPYDYGFNYTHYGVDKYIVDMESAAVDFDMSVTISSKDMSGNAVPAKYSDLSFRVPAGLYGYCVETGQKIDGPEDEPIIGFSGEYLANDGVFTFTYRVNRFNKAAAGAKFETDPATGDRTFSYPGSISFLGGKVQANNGGDNNMSGLVEIKFNLNTLRVLRFDGTVFYELQDLNAEQVVLNDLPDVLTQDANIILANPQIYLSVENPLADYGVQGSSGLTITPQRDGVDVDPQTIASMPTDLIIDAVAGTQNFCLTPDPDKLTSFYDAFANPAPKKFRMDQLGSILAGNGLPESLNIEFDSPRMLERKVHDFALGTSHGAVTGIYTFYAPLQFDNNSHIIYNETQSGWELDSDLEISKLSIKARVVSDLPVKVVLIAKAIDKDKQIIPGVSTASAEIKPGESDVVLEMTGAIRNLDGIEYTVKLLAEGDASVLKPTMSLNLSDLKVTVSGFYESTDDGDDDDDDDVYPDFNDSDYSDYYN